MYRNSYGSRRPLPVKKNKHKLFALIIKRATIRIIKSSFEVLKSVSENEAKSLKVITKASQKNLEVCKLFAWEKIKTYSKQVKSEQRVFKDIFILSKRLQMLALRKSFHKIQTFGYRVETFFCKRLLSSRNIILYRTFRKLFLGKKKEVLLKIQNYCRFEKAKKRLSVVPLIRKNLQKKLLLQVWSRLLYKAGQSNEISDDKVEQLQVQLQDMRVQIDNKNENIERLNGQISELKQSISLRIDSASFMGLYNNRSYSSLNKSRAKYSCYQKQSNDGSVKQQSFGSLFSGSFFSKKSNNKSLKKLEGDCNCSGSQKYERYKSANQTLKKQLQIIKTQLQFTKDMNEHMQNEMKQYFGNGDENMRKSQKVKLELRQVQRERDALKEKVVKCEKYTVKLKAQFKTKVEQIYRRFKKNA